MTGGSNIVSGSANKINGDENLIGSFNIESRMKRNFDFPEDGRVNWGCADCVDQHCQSVGGVEGGREW